MENKDQEPIILGTVKKGRTGKPILAIIIIVFVALLIYFLPNIQSLFGEKSIVDYILGNNNDNNVPVNVVQDKFVKIGDNVNLENANLIISEIQLNDNVLSYKIKSRTATYDAGKDDLYLQIYHNKETLVYTKSLDEIFTITDKEVKINVSFYKNNNDYYAILKNITSEDIEDMVLSTDESGIGSITCSLDNDSYEYIFQNKELIEINRTYQYKYVDDKANDYQIAYKTYSDLKNSREKYNIITSLNEDYVGFNYKESIDLSKVTVTDLGNNYFPYKTLAKVINFKQEAKGFDCE